MKIYDYLKINQPTIINKLVEYIGPNFYLESDIELDPEFDFYKKLMEGVPNKYK